MDLYYIKIKREDGNGAQEEIHFLVDNHTRRAYGYIELPQRDSVMFIAAPYDGKNRYYIDLEPAQAYLEQIAIQDNEQESEAFEGHFKDGVVPVAPLATP